MGILLILALMAVIGIATVLLPAALDVVMGALPSGAVAFIATANVVVLPLAGVVALVLLFVGGKAFMPWIHRLTGREIARGVLLGLLCVAGIVFLITRQ